MTCVSVESRVSKVLLQSLRTFFFSNCVELLLCLFSDTAVALWHFKDPDRGEKKLLITPSWIHHSEKAFDDAEPGKGLSESAASHLAAVKCPAHDVNVCLWDVLLRNVHRSDLCQTSQHMRWDSNDWTALGLCSKRLQTHAGRHIDSSVLCRLHEKNKSSRYWTFNTWHVEWQRHTKLWIHIQSIFRNMHRSRVKLWSEELGDCTSRVQVCFCSSSSHLSQVRLIATSRNRSSWAEIVWKLVCFRKSIWTSSLLHIEFREQLLVLFIFFFGVRDENPQIFIPGLSKHILMFI